MADFIFEDLNDDEQIDFDPAGDTLVFENPLMHAGFLLVDHNQTTTDHVRIHDDGPYTGTSIFLLDIAPGELTAADFDFAGGGRVLIGDNTASTANDNGANTLTGTAAGDFFMGMGGNDVLSGGAGDDMFSFFTSGGTSAGVDQISGGAGFDRIFLGNSEATLGVTIDLEAGTLSGYLPGTSATFSSIEMVNTTSRDDSITGSSADDDLDANSGNDTVRGGLGNDTVWGMPGNDLLDGGGGVDTAMYEESSFEVDVNLATGVAGDGSGFTDTLVSIENVVGSEFVDFIAGNAGANVLEGGDGGDELEGSGGNDRLIGGAGNDTLDGGAGADSMVGGAGNDTYFVDESGDEVIEAAGGGNDTVITSVSMALPGNVENILFTGGASLIITGNAKSNVIGGGSGNDTLNGGAGKDTVSYALADAPVTINLTTDIATGYGTDVLSGFENATGGTRADTLIGNESRNVLDGGKGADTMQGGFGNDTYIVDRLTDRVQEDSNSVSGGLVLPGEDDGSGLAGVAGITDTVIAAVNFSLARIENVENLTLSGNAARATGNALANKLVGNDGNDTLNGGARNDTLDGKSGSDRLLGGKGNDKLVWGAGDTIDGGGGKDKLKVSVNLDLTSLPNAAIKGIETIDMNGGGNDTLTLNQQDMLDISSSTDTLTVLGNDGDSVSAAGFTAGAASGGFRTYSHGTATLLVDTDVDVFT